MFVFIYFYSEAEIGSHVNNLLNPQNKLIAETVLRECCVGWEKCEFVYVNVFVFVCAFNLIYIARQWEWPWTWPQVYSLVSLLLLTLKLSLLRCLHWLLSPVPRHSHQHGGLWWPRPCRTRPLGPFAFPWGKSRVRIPFPHRPFCIYLLFFFFF